MQVNLRKLQLKRCFVAASAVSLALFETTAHASIINAQDILGVDQLGYECIAETALIDSNVFRSSDAFASTELDRLPRACMPSPCERALSPNELSHITGTDVVLARFKGEWDDYYARYSDHCRSETVAFPDPASYDDPHVPEMCFHKPDPIEDFWGPLVANAAGAQAPAKLASLVNAASGRPALTNGAGRLSPVSWGGASGTGAPAVNVSPWTPTEQSAFFTPASASSDNASDDNQSQTTPANHVYMMAAASGSGGGTQPADPTTTTPTGPATPVVTPVLPTGPAPVPLPASGLLLAAALAFFGRRGRQA
jgi:hypothetical protein